jgi:hypothetical protein
LQEDGNLFTEVIYLKAPKVNKLDGSKDEE